MRVKRAKPVIGWREWVSLPDLGIAAIKAKVDTGARTSSLHAFDIHRFRRRGRSMVRFKVHPYQRDLETTVEAEAAVLERRTVKSSSGHEQERIVIGVVLDLGGIRWPIELTLTSRDSMGFRMLLGRQAIRPHYTVDPGRSYLSGKPAGARRLKKRTRHPS